MGLFDKEMFMRANKKREEEFGDIEAGTYIATLDDAFIGPSKTSGRNQLLLRWRISEDDPMYAKRLIFQTVGLDANDDATLETCYSIVSTLANILGIKDMESFSDDPNMHLTKCIETEARLTVKYNDAGYQQLKINKVLDQKYDATLFNGSSSSDENEITLEAGLKVLVTTKDGQFKGTIAEIHSADKIDVTLNTGEKLSVSLPQLELFEWEENKLAEEFKPEPLTEEEKDKAEAPLETTVEEEKEIELLNLGEQVDLPPLSFDDLEKGMTVTGKYKGESYTGTIHSLDEFKDIVIIAVGNKGIPCPLDTIEIV